jgi:hypothetical protein
MYDQQTVVMVMLYLMPQVIYMHGKPWWSNIDRAQLLIRPPELSGNPTSRASGSKQEEQAKEIINLILGI